MRVAWHLGPMDRGGLAGADMAGATAVVVPVPVAASGPPPPVSDVAAMTYAAEPEKKGLAHVLAAWAAARREGEELVVAGTPPRAPVEGVRWPGTLAATEYRALLRRARVFVTAPRREDYGIAQLEALADGCALVTSEAAGAYPAARLARVLDPRLVGDDLAGALRAALDAPDPAYSERAAALLEPFTTDAVDRVVAEELLPRLLRSGAAA